MYFIGKTKVYVIQVAIPKYDELETGKVVLEDISKFLSPKIIDGKISSKEKDFLQLEAAFTFFNLDEAKSFAESWFKNYNNWRIVSFTIKKAYVSQWGCGNFEVVYSKIKDLIKLDQEKKEKDKKSSLDDNGCLVFR